MILNDQERERFRQYCVEESKSCRDMAEQMKLVGSPPNFIALYRTKGVAFALIAVELGATETMMVSNGG
jgi:hypothetical protein